MFELILQASSLFEIPEGVLVQGGVTKVPNLVRAREWICEQLPHMSHGRLARVLGYSNHTAVIHMRNRIRRRKTRGIVEESRRGRGPWYVQ